MRALLAPLTVKQFKSMQAMVRIAPQLKELQAKHKNDKARQQQEVMKFYAEHKVNPFASCLPLIAQMPFFIGLFYLLQSDLKSDICGRAALAMKDKPCAEIPGAMTGNEDFLFIADLTVKATGWVLAVLIVMYITSQLLSSVLTPSTGDRNQRMIMYGLPFVFVLFVINFPTGLIVYWITTNLWTVGQGYILRKRMGPMVAPPGTEPAIAGLPSPNARGGGFMARMAAATSSAAEAKASGDGEPADASPSATARAAKKHDREGAHAGGRGREVGRRRAAEGGEVGAPRARSRRRSRRVTGPPRKPPRKKKKRSGRRR